MARQRLTKLPKTKDKILKADPEMIILSEASQRKTNMMSHMQNLKMTHMNLFTKQKQTHREQSSKGKAGGRD